jgi:hypothetical protein
MMRVFCVVFCRVLVLEFKKKNEASQNSFSLRGRCKRVLSPVVCAACVVLRPRATRATNVRTMTSFLLSFVATGPAR